MTAVSDLSTDPVSLPPNITEHTTRQLEEGSDDLSPSRTAH
jgi:hypothetical protein